MIISSEKMNAPVDPELRLERYSRRGAMGGGRYGGYYFPTFYQNRVNSMYRVMIIILKIISYFLNGVLLLEALTMIVVAGLTMNDLSSISYWLSHVHIMPTIVLLTMGITVLVITAFGVSGGIKESSFMLIVYTIIVTGTAIGEFIGGLLAAQAIEHYPEYSLLKLRASQKKFLETGKERSQWKQLQLDLDCCGVEDPSTWIVVLPSPEVPKSCCLEGRKGGYDDIDILTCNASQDLSNIVTKGCWEKLVLIVVDKNTNLLGLAFAFALIQLVVVVFSACLTYVLIKRRVFRHQSSRRSTFF